MLIPAQIVHEALSRCSALMRAYSPFSAISAAGVPCSATAPSLSTTILSAPATVRIRWAITRTVLFFMSRDSALCISVSFSTSRLAVASSSRMMGASLRNARAMDILCLSPPDRVQPFSPILLL